MAFGDNATVYAIRGQEFHFVEFIKDSTTGNPCAVGTLTLSLSLDGAAVAANQTGTSTAAISGMTGGVKVTIGALDATCNVLAYTLSSNTANAVTATGEIKFLTLTENTLRADSQTVVRAEQFWQQGWAFKFNQNYINRETGTYDVYNAAASAVLWTSGAAGISDNGTIAIRGKLT